MYLTLLVGVWLSSGRSNVKVPHLALQGVSKVFVLIENAMYRTLLATCGSAEGR